MEGRGEAPQEIQVWLHFLGYTSPTSHPAIQVWLQLDGYIRYNVGNIEVSIKNDGYQPSIMALGSIYTVEGCHFFLPVFRGMLIGLWSKSWLLMYLGQDFK